LFKEQAENFIKFLEQTSSKNFFTSAPLELEPQLKVLEPSIARTHEEWSAVEGAGTPEGAAAQKGTTAPPCPAKQKPLLLFFLSQSLLTILRFSGGLYDFLRGLYAILSQHSHGLLLEVIVDVKGGSVKQPLLLLGNQCLK
jgi:hypothetical protein